MRLLIVVIERLLICVEVRLPLQLVQEEERRLHRAIKGEARGLGRTYSWKSRPAPLCARVAHRSWSSRSLLVPLFSWRVFLSKFPPAFLRWEIGYGTSRGRLRGLGDPKSLTKKEFLQLASLLLSIRAQPGSRGIIWSSICCRLFCCTVFLVLSRCLIPESSGSKVLKSHPRGPPISNTPGASYGTSVRNTIYAALWNCWL